MISLKWKNHKQILLYGDKCIAELHLKQPGFIYSACRQFTKHHERIKTFRETGHLKHLYRNELYKPCFGHDPGYSDSEDLAKITISDKVLREKAYEIIKNPKYDGYLRALASMVYKFFDKKNRIRSECKWKTSWRIT